MLFYRSTCNIHWDDIEESIHDEENIDAQSCPAEDAHIPRELTQVVTSGNVEPVPHLRPPTKRSRSSNDKILALLEARREEREKIIDSLNKEPDDDVDLFFKSITKSVKKLRPDLISEAKLKTLQMLIDLEARNTAMQLIMTSPESDVNSTYTYITSPSPSGHSSTSNQQTENVYLFKEL